MKAIILVILLLTGCAAPAARPAPANPYAVQQKQKVTDADVAKTAERQRERDIDLLRQPEREREMRAALRTVYVGMAYGDFRALAQQHQLRRDDASSFSSATMRSERYIYSPGWTVEATKQYAPSGHYFTIQVRGDRIVDWLSTFPD